MTAAQATVLAKLFHGPDAYAEARKGRRYVCKTVGPLSMTYLGSGTTWSEAFTAARAKAQAA